MDRSRHSDSNPFRQPASAPVISEAARPGAGTHLSADTSRPLAGLRRLARRADGRSWIPVPQHRGPAAWFWSRRPPAPHEAPRASPRLPAGSPSARSSPAHEHKGPAPFCLRAPFWGSPTLAAPQLQPPQHPVPIPFTPAGRAPRPKPSAHSRLLLQAGLPLTAASASRTEGRACGQASAGEPTRPPAPWGGLSGEDDVAFSGVPAPGLSTRPAGRPSPA